MCGVHIHIGLNGHTPKSLRNLANIMASHESLLISAMRLDRNRINRYCRTVDPSFKGLTEESQRQWNSLQTFGTKEYGAAEISTTTIQDTEC